MKKLIFLIKSLNGAQKTFSPKNNNFIKKKIISRLKSFRIFSNALINNYTRLRLPFFGRKKFRLRI